MKKIYLTILVVLFLLPGVHAQNGSGFGLKAGVNIAALDGADVNDPEPRLGYHLGVLVSTRMFPSVYLQPELQLSLQGEADRGPGGALNLLYLNAPIMAKVMLGPAFNLQFGPYAAVLLNAQQGEADVKSLTNSFDFGAGLGVGYLHAGRWTLDARYQYGLMRVVDKDVNPFNKVGNRVVQLSVGFLLGGSR